MISIVFERVSNACGSGADRTRAVGGASWVAHGGEVFGLLRLNGAGKTTTSRMPIDLTDDFALDLAGMTLSQAVGISGDGLQIAGDSTNANGRPEAWLADLTCADGDLNHDGACSLLDVEPLLDCLLTGRPCGYADLNRDSQRDGRDIHTLVDCIVAP